MKISLPVKLARRWGVIPLLSEDGGALQIAMSSMPDEEQLQNITAYFERPIAPVRWSEKDVDRERERRYGLGAEFLEDEDMVGFVTHLLDSAHHERATDIHLEPFEDTVDVRFRIDGLLYPKPMPALIKKFQTALLSRIKVMAQMNVAETRRPQDGRFHWGHNGTNLDVRVSTIPTLYGESMDLRLLPKERLVMSLTELGMPSHVLEKISKLIHKPNGIILVTGPTGHGKTTTLYACLSRINTFDKKIIALEDPVEYQLKGINQIQIHTQIGVTFSDSLRAVLRHDPDVLMVGEIRDRETADISVRASLTGHLVFSTLHTTDSLGAITRLLDMGVEPYLLASSLQAILAQRLVRVVCPSCLGKNSPCESCLGTGYRGRTGLFELLEINDSLREKIQSRVEISDLKAHVKSTGLRTLYQEGLEKVESGITTVGELARVAEAT